MLCKAFKNVFLLFTFFFSLTRKKDAGVQVALQQETRKPLEYFNPA